MRGGIPRKKDSVQKAVFKMFLQKAKQSKIPEVYNNFHSQ
jgi:hypothetical protein